MLPPYSDRPLIHERLKVIFPDGTTNRNYVVREMAASTVFCMLYVGAIEGSERWIAPKHVIRMTDEQAARADDASREAYGPGAMKPGFRTPGTRWYEDNSRESVRDETIRNGLITNNAALERPGLATTSGVPRYALRAGFASLFDPELLGEALLAAVTAWQVSNLSPAALARVTLVRRGAVTTGEGELISFPNGETRRMAAGPSSVITKAVIEQFCPRFLATPAVLWLSESGAKVVARDDALATQLGLKISPDKTLPDIILVDLGVSAAASMLLVFVEVVATDGPITTARQQAFLKIANDAGFTSAQLAFVTAYLDRSNRAFRKNVSELAWQSFAWFASEPTQIMQLHDGANSPLPLERLLKL
jgi:hypothetical protein